MEQVHGTDAWGNPIKWPGLLLGCPHAFSPTTLRYVATGLWLAQNGFVEPGSTVVELGVGFGGLAAVNALVSQAQTHLVDLPPVERLALKMLGEIGLPTAARRADVADLPKEFCFVSNYAFTELSREAQDIYCRDFIRFARRGVIVSNAAVFSAGVGGRSDAELLEMLHQAGIPAQITNNNNLLGPADAYCDVALITWQDS